MKKFNFSKKVLGLAASALGTVAIVGAGFSAWYFTEDLTNLTNSTDNKNNVVVTVAYQSGEVGLTDADYSSDQYILVLDQGGASNASVTDKGIALILASGYDENDNNKNGTQTYGDSIVTDGSVINSVENICALWKIDAESYKVISAKYDITYTATVTLNNNLGTYVSMGTVDSVTADTDNIESNGGVALKVTTPTFSWVTGQKPTTFKDYQTMVAALDSTTYPSSDNVPSGEDITIDELVTITFTISFTAKN